MSDLLESHEGSTNLGSFDSNLRSLNNPTYENENDDTEYNMNYRERGQEDLTRLKGGSVNLKNHENAKQGQNITQQTRSISSSNNHFNQHSNHHQNNNNNYPNKYNKNMQINFCFIKLDDPLLQHRIEYPSILKQKSLMNEPKFDKELKEKLCKKQNNRETDCKENFNEVMNTKNSNEDQNLICFKDICKNFSNKISDSNQLEFIKKEKNHQIKQITWAKDQNKPIIQTVPIKDSEISSKSKLINLFHFHI